MMHKYPALAVLLSTACVLPLRATAEDSAALYLRAQAESVDTVRGRDADAFGHAELRWQYNAPLQNALRGVFTARRGDGGNTVQVNELSLERPVGTGFLTAGKKVMSWDVGYAFRPLDVVQQEDRRALNPVTLEGVPMLAWEAFDAERAVTVVLSNPGHGRAEQPRGDGSLAVRLYRQNGTRDEYAVLRLSERNGVEGGVSFSQVATPEFEVHGSVLLQQRHEEWLAGSRASPQWGSWQHRSGGGKALAGFTWTNEAKLSVLGEAWLDRTAARRQQRNVLLRAGWNCGDVDLSVDVLWQPGSDSQGSSRIGSVAVSWKPGPWLFSASLRRFSAAAGGAGAGVRSIAVATVRYAF